MRGLFAGVAGIGVFLVITKWWSGSPDMGIWIAAVAMFTSAWLANKLLERLL